MLDHQANGQGFDPSIGASPPHEQWQRTIRELPPAQLYHFQWHLLRLEDGFRRSRFANPTSDAFQKKYGGPANGNVTVVFGSFVNGQLRGAVEMRSLQSDGCRTAEIVFSVERAWQGRGIGTALMVAAVRAARERGIDHLYLRCHALNRRMQRITDRGEGRL